MLSKSKRSINRLQQQQTWSIYFTTFSILTWKRLIASFVVKSFTLGGNVKYVSFLRRKSSSKTTGVIVKRSWGRKFTSIDWYWQCRRLQSRIVEIKIFGGGSRTSLFDVYSCLRAKDLRGVLDYSYQKKCSRLQKRLQPWHRGGKLPSGRRRIRSNLFIVVNNVIADCWTITINNIFHRK